MDRELQILREAALISMSKKARLQEAKELADLREAALHSARERKLSDPQRKRRLETPPSHHYNNRSSPSYDSDGSGQHTPKMSECDSPQHTPHRDDSVQNTVFTVKVTDSVLIKRNQRKCSRSSESGKVPSIASIPDSPVSADNNITVSVANKDSPDEPRNGDSLRDVDIDNESSDVKSVDEIPKPQVEKPRDEKHNEKSPEPIKDDSKGITVTEVSPALSKISSVDVPRDLSEPKKPRKKHKKNKGSGKRKKSSKTLESSSEDERISSSKSGHSKLVKSQNGGSRHDRESKKNSRDKVKSHKTGSEEKLGKIPRDLKKEIISELDSKIDKNIEMLHRAKKLRNEHKISKPKKVISEISSAEENELLGDIKMKSSSPNHKKEKLRESSRPQSRSPASVPDISVSLKSKREFEQMKAEMNKNAPKPNEKEDLKKQTARKSRKRSPSPARKDQVSKKEVSPVKKGAVIIPRVIGPPLPVAELPKPRPIPMKPVTPSSDVTEIVIDKKEEEQLLGTKDKPLDTTDGTIAADEGGDAVNVLREDDSSSESDQGGDIVSVSSNMKTIDAKKKKLKKSKKKKSKEEKRRKKKRKKRSVDGSSSSDSDSPEKKKAKVKIDKSELNKIVQFLKQRDEQQKALECNFGASKAAFNPKIISKDTKPIEIKLKSKPKR